MFPENAHLGKIIQGSVILGLWPLVYDCNPFKKLYKIYSYFMTCYFTITISTCYIKLAIVLSGGEAAFEEISQILVPALGYATTFARVIVIKSEAMKKFLREILRTEKGIFERNDPEVRGIYEDCAKVTRFCTSVYLWSWFTVICAYAVRPLFLEPIVKTVGNETIVIKPLMVDNCVLFSSPEHYVSMYIYQVVNVATAVWFVACADFYIYSLITYIVGQLKIMSHTLRNLDKYGTLMKKEKNIESDEAAEFEMMKKAILMHKRIIGIVEEFNKSFRMLIVADFLEGPLRLACLPSLLMQAGEEISLMIILSVCILFGSMFLRFLLFYYNANEVIVQSRELNRAIWESKWYQKSPRVKSMVLIFMIGAKKELALQIGPFGVMSLETYLNMLKVMYSYITLLYGLNSQKQQRN